jgi:hypothetical protein
MDSQIFRRRLQGSKVIRLKSSLYHWKVLKTKMSKMGSHDPFVYLKHKLHPKEKVGSQSDAPPSSLMDSTMNLKVTTTEGKGVGVHSLARSISWVEGQAGTLRWALGRMISKSTIYMDLHKPNKLISV